MIVHNQKNVNQKSDIISASEIGQFNFCELSWYLQRCGYNPESQFIEKGEKKHEHMGEVISSTEKKIKNSKILKIIGYILLLISFIILLYEVVL